MRAWFAALSAFIVLWSSATSFAQAPGSSPPDWWASHVAYMTRDGGLWRTPNPQANADANAPDAFEMEWRAVNEGTGLIGRLYGIDIDQEGVEFWTFREFWHPGERRVIFEQWGGPGVYGAGETRASAPNRGEIDQTFWLPDGRSWREGHRTVEGEDGYLTEVYDIDAAGGWTLRNASVWQRVRANE
jgi:hypothetical protein